MFGCKLCQLRGSLGRLSTPSFFRSACHGSVGDSEASQQGATTSKDVGSVEMDGGTVGATVVDSGSGGSGEG